jgi:hypothetical protein
LGFGVRGFFATCLVAGAYAFVVVGCETTGAPISWVRIARNWAAGMAPASSLELDGFIELSGDGQYAQASSEAKRSQP